jgi:uncharacterized protein (TIGR02099 family)
VNSENRPDDLPVARPGTASRPLLGATLWLSRALTTIVLILGFGFAAVVLLLRYWLLPDIASYRGTIESALTSAAGQRVTVGAVAANWDGLRPQLALTRVVLHDSANRPALELPRIDATLSWRSAAMLRINFHAVDIYQPILSVRRSKNGDITVAGMSLGAGDGGGGFSRWVLDQRDIEIHGGVLHWDDELRGAPRLTLDRVQLRLVNSGTRHRFALRALPPSSLASAIDVRGDLRGDTFQALSEAMTGQLYLQVPHVDVGGWRPWVNLPMRFPAGSGALRAWVGMTDSRLSSLIADTEFHDVTARLGEGLPELNMPYLSGRFSWKALRDGFLVSTRKLTFRTGDQAELAPVDLTLQLTALKDGHYGNGEFRANALQLRPLAVLADRLPVSASLREWLSAHKLAGSLFDVSARWSGTGDRPDRYAVRARFQDLSLAAHARRPGFSGFSGNIAGTEKGGTLHVTSQNATLAMPGVFRDALQFDALTGQMGWSHAAAGIDLRFANFSFANADLAGTLFGSFRVSGDGPGESDLTGHLSRARADRVTRYLPLAAAPASRPWLDQAFVAGTSSDVRFRLKGDLKDFPFADGKSGLFEVSAKVDNGVLRYALAWPRVEAISGDLLFRGARMEVNAREARIGATRLSRVRAVIASLAERPLLELSGVADGETAQFLDFIRESPVRDLTDRFADSMRAEGSGTLNLKLALPLERLERTRVAGSYQFVNNRLHLDPALPPLERASGRLEFSESSVVIPQASGQFLGGPLTVTGSTQRDGTVNIGLRGRVDAEVARRAGKSDWVRYFRGATDWSGTLVMRKRDVDLILESNLRGLALNLPAPLIKPAADLLPVRFERRLRAGRPERLALSVGELAAGVMVRRNAGNDTVPERAVLRFGKGDPVEPERAGLVLSGRLETVDVGGWLTLLDGGTEASGTTLPLAVTNLDVSAGRIHWFGRRFGELSIKGSQREGALVAAIAGDEVQGGMTWSAPSGKDVRGRFTARLKKLVLPPVEASISEPQAPAAADAAPRLPALDVSVESFVLGVRAVGGLELRATPQGRDWRIERLRIANPESVMMIDGSWQAWSSKPRTQVMVRLDISDIGKFLARWGHAEGVRRGTAKVEGNLSWSGGPQRIDYPTLSGNFVLDAAKGQFVKLEPGIGKLLGTLSLQSLPRRISLDFRDIFSEGLAFDEIVGAIKVNNGVASTDNLRIVGPAARINMSGKVDLVRETQELRVKINPQLSDTVSVAGALIGGPVAGVAAFLAQKILKDPLDQIASYEYDISGTWADPVVKKRDPPPSPPGEGQPPG